MLGTYVRIMYLIVQIGLATSRNLVAALGTRSRSRTMRGQVLTGGIILRHRSHVAFAVDVSMAGKLSTSSLES